MFATREEPDQDAATGVYHHCSVGRSVSPLPRLAVVARSSSIVAMISFKVRKLGALQSVESC